jgi:Zn-dependent protease with chaperone function
VGHLYLKHVRRGVALMVISLACLGIMADRAMQHASTLLGKLESQGGAIDAGQLPDLLTQMSNSPASPLVTIASLVLAGCWLAGIVDAYRLGNSSMGASR